MLLPRPEIRITSFFIREFYHSPPRFPPSRPPARPNVYNLLLCGIPPPIPPTLHPLS
ncbi:hypothetical protein BURCENBC7_AP7793 [Burkholderia cenocepacia BC7]|nr:riboflavin kinase/flavin mononucleotide adenylyltransferase [Burkholderia cenocepacia]EPZ86100.1 hypothetical protein BURCENK562V_C6194 [Burkholderia cenocepacia K56-2Valvano]ERI30520.1 hypothetical protein BURCENBC7_AP7793 [Burkholderia cenocepacia BC7]CDN61105.1 Riboflavin kinase / FMN adenylyltransferase [Burkholderia cenocepacia H111]